MNGESRVVALGAMNYSYLKLTLSLRKAGFDAVLLDYDWRRDIEALGKQLAERIAADGHDEVALIGHSMGGLVARAALTHAAGKHVSQLDHAGHAEFRIARRGAGAARHVFGGAQDRHARPAARRGISWRATCSRVFPDCTSCCRPTRA